MIRPRPRPRPRLASSLRLLVIIIVVAFSTEALIMLALPVVMPYQRIWLDALLDSALLVAMLLPALYFFMVRPLELQMATRRSAEERLANILDTAADAIIIADEDFRISLFNQGAQKLYGYHAQEVAGRPIDILLPERFRERQRQRIHDFSLSPEAALRLGERRPVLGRRKDGSEFPAVVSVSKLIQAGKLTFTVIVHDITKLKRIEEALRQTNEELEQRVHERTVDLIGVNEALQAEIAEREQIEKDLLDTLAESHQREAEIAALLAGSRAVLTHRDFAKAAQAIFDSCKDLLGVTAGSVVLLTEDGKENQVVFLDPGGPCPAVDPSPPAPVRGLLAPLNIDGKTVGLLSLANKPQGFTENDARMASAFGELASIALLNSRTLDALENSEKALRRARDELERRVQERTTELAQANAALRAGINWREGIEDELRSSEELFRQLAENIREIFWVAAPEGGQIIYVSPTYETLWGRTRESLYQDPASFVEAVIPEDRARITAVFETKVEFEVECRIADPTGSIRWIRMRGFPIQNAKGEVYRTAGIAEDVTEQVRAFQLLEQRVQERTQEVYEQAQHLAALEERQHLARELHDSLSQTLYGVALGAHTALAFIDGKRDKVVEALNYVLSLADAGLTQMRALIFDLRPESLEAEGLVSALTKQAAALRARYGIEVQAEICEEPDVPLETKQATYRIAQEALHNAIKHARANRLGVRLSYQQDHLMLEVSDDGAGFDPAKSYPGHLGLNSMRERAARARGTLEIHSAPGNGTRVCVELPVCPKTSPVTSGSLVT